MFKKSGMNLHGWVHIMSEWKCLLVSKEMLFWYILSCFNILNVSLTLGHRKLILQLSNLIRSNIYQHKTEVESVFPTIMCIKKMKLVFGIVINLSYRKSCGFWKKYWIISGSWQVYWRLLIQTICCFQTTQYEVMKMVWLEVNLILYYSNSLTLLWPAYWQC
jgi:hypothetical protein